MARRRYFVTGALGFLGQHVVKAICDHDPSNEVRVFDLKPRPTLLGVEDMPEVKLVFGDTRIPATLADAMVGVDTVIHCAGLISFSSASSDRLIQTNIIGTQNVLQAALDQQCRSFVLISSISTIGIVPGRVSDETIVPDLPEKRRGDPYGYSKLLAEFALQGATDHIRSVILNPAVILGPGSRLIEKIERQLRIIPLCLINCSVNSFVDVREVAMAVVLAITRGTIGQRYIVTTSNLDNLSFMRLVMRTLNRNAPVFPIPECTFALYDTAVIALEALHLNPGLESLRPSMWTRHTAVERFVWRWVGDPIIH